MRDVVRADMGKPSDKLTKPTIDWGLNYPKSYIFFAWRVWRMSSYAVYPNGKPYDEQPHDLIEDFFELERSYSYEAAYLKDEK